MKIILSLIALLSFLGLITINIEKAAVSNEVVEIDAGTEWETPAAKENLSLRKNVLLTR
jgi:hypothetical protein